MQFIWDRERKTFILNLNTKKFTATVFKTDIKNANIDLMQVNLFEIECTASDFTLKYNRKVY